MNPTLQMDHISELKRESYNQLNQGCVESMAATLTSTQNRGYIL